MSIKTLRKRIALVAVSALGAGLLSVAPASAVDNAATNASNAASAANLLNIATAADAVAVVSSTVTAANGNRSVGLLNNSTTLTTSSLTSTATMLSTGTLVFYSTGVADQNSTIIVSGGKVVNSASTGSSAASADQTNYTTVLQDAAVTFAVAVKPDAGVTSMTVELYKNASLTDPSDAAGSLAAARAIVAGSTSKGSLIQKYFVTVAAASNVGTYSAADSRCVLGTSSTSSTGATDSTGAGVIANAASAIGYVDINLRDAYEGALSGALTVEASNGAAVAYDGTHTPISSASSYNLVAVSYDSNGKINVARPSAFANKSFTTTVTVKYNGVVVCTKSIRFEGEVASIKVDGIAIAPANGSATASMARTSYADDKGFPLYPSVGTAKVVATTLNSYVTDVTEATAANSTTGARGRLTVTCASSSSSYLGLGDGSANLQLYLVNTISGTTVKSNVWNQKCAGDAYNFTASLDKASYTPGSVATVTITFKTAKGNLTYCDFAISSATTADALTVAGLGTPVTAPASTDTACDEDGVKQYQYVVSNTEGTYTAVVSVPLVTANSLQSPVTIPFTVKAATTGVTNAEVLAAIVKLIASINKQIRALQKSLKR